MPTDEDREAVPSPISVHETLARIADTLGCPVETFTDEAYDRLNVTGLSDLLTLWVEMNDDADRVKLLDFARRLAQP